MVPMFLLFCFFKESPNQKGKRVPLGYLVSVGIQGLGCKVSELKVQGFGLRVQGFGGLGSRI